MFLHNLYDQILPDMLFNLFSQYGYIEKIKIFYTKRDMALIQFRSASEAQQAQKYLNNLTFFGKTMLVNYSRNNFMNMPEKTE